jgi:hypothetical protein
VRKIIRILILSFKKINDQGKLRAPSKPSAALLKGQSYEKMCQIIIEGDALGLKYEPLPNFKFF